MTPTPSDSAGGSTHAGADDAPGNPAAPQAQPAQAVPHFALGGMGGFAQPAHSHGGGAPHALAGAIHAQPAHSMQNSVFTARRWDRATGSTSTVGGVREKSEDSAGDSCGGGVSLGGAVDGPMDSTQAQHRAGAVRGGHADHSDDDGEEVEGGGRRGARGDERPIPRRRGAPRDRPRRRGQRTDFRAVPDRRDRRWVRRG